MRSWYGEPSDRRNEATAGAGKRQTGSCVVAELVEVIGGGVLEPIGAMPVIIEDDVLVGGRRYWRTLTNR